MTRLDVGHWGVKLSAINDKVSIRPGQLRLKPKTLFNSPAIQDYKLQHPEIMILRENDTILFSKTTASLTLSWDDPEVQVNSSIVGEEIPESDEAPARGESEETEDEDLDRTNHTLDSNGGQPNSTPVPSGLRSEIVQETPTAHRINQLTSFWPKSGPGDVVENTPPLEKVPVLQTFPSVATTTDVLETFSTVPTKPVDGADTIQDVKKYAHNDEETLLEPPMETRPTETSVSEPQENNKRSHPIIEIRSNPPKGILRSNWRRQSPDLKLEAAPGASFDPNSTKRAKVDESDGDGGHKPPPKRKKRVTLDAQPVSPNGTRGSQRSVREGDLYTGPKPRVAFSNSGIPSMGNAIKFLRRHGGSTVESVNDDCNILWYVIEKNYLDQLIASPPVSYKTKCC